MNKKLVLLPFLLISSLFLAFYVMDVQAQSTSGGPGFVRISPSGAAPSGAAGAKRTLAAPACSGFYGTMKATNWPGGKLTLTCPGKNRQRGKCVGASKQLSPGEQFSFNNCNCLDPKTKCLTVSNLPPGCKVKSKLACASNRETVDGSFQVECGPSPSPCVSGAPSDAVPSDAVPSDTIPSDILPSDVLDVSEEPSMVPSFVCLILGADGECAEPTAAPDDSASTEPCTSPPATDPGGAGTNTGGSTDTSGGSGSDSTGGSDAGFGSGTDSSSGSTGEFGNPSFFDAAPSDAFGQTP